MTSKRKSATKQPNVLANALNGLRFQFTGEEIARLWEQKAEKHEAHRDDWLEAQRGFAIERDQHDPEDPAQKPEWSSQQQGYEYAKKHVEGHELEASACRFLAEHVMVEHDHILTYQEAAMLNPFIPIPRE